MKRFADAGVDAITMRIDGLPHQELMKSIELFGKYVIPTFKNPRSVVRSSEKVLADIREARPAHYAEIAALEASADRPRDTITIGQNR